MDIQQVFPTPDLHSARRILAVQPHYDDNDIAAGGLLAALAHAGVEIFYLTVTNDLVGLVDEKITDPEAATQLDAEQAAAGTVIGVRGQFRLGFPDAGPFDHFDLRRGVIQHIRMLKPDFLLTVDPWSPYEAHTDHLRTGKAAAEAAILYGFSRLKTVPEVDDFYQLHDVKGIAFYNTWTPNTFFDITNTREQKHKALDAYKAQFNPQDLDLLHMWVEFRERMHAEQCTAQGCTHAEAFKVLNPRLLHCVGEAWNF